MKKKKEKGNNQLVAYSRAGDVFHYRWAARRSLRLLYPNTTLEYVVIEGSDELKKVGEYVIDVSEYYDTKENPKIIDYYQLKHTTVRKQEAMSLADMKKTLTGFADRFRQHLKEINKGSVSISFNIVTNRKINSDLKDQFMYLSMGEECDSRFLKTLQDYTKLKGKQLAEFCAFFCIEDSEGDYNVQNIELRAELSQLVAGAVSSMQVETLVSMVQEKVLPGSDNKINREEVLKRFGITNERELFPAPPRWEKLDTVLTRDQYADIIYTIKKTGRSAIVHAAGGVGKSVFSQHLVKSTPHYSLTIAYDCFGTGSYRNRSSLRHRYRDALVQVANELGSKGICSPLIVLDTTPDDAILRNFLDRIAIAAAELKKIDTRAELYIVIDAADNAEMAADEYADNCFAHELLREKIPDGVKLIMLCRTERQYLLKPNQTILSIELNPFSEKESLQNLHRYFPEATVDDGIEFHRLTSGNPRVQANALALSYSGLPELLASFGKNPMTVDKQIEQQLRDAVAKIKDNQTPNFQENIDSICIGLASLPPHIPITILANVAGVSVEAIRSFIADLGRPLWISDSSLQFRDEPTETWFRTTYLAKKEDYLAYITRLEPLAAQSIYVAEVLPQLYLQAGKYDKLIKIALSDDLLPDSNPIDARNVRIFRLRFAFIAALKSNKLKDAVQLGMRAGEEVAGNSRQFSLFINNIDLLSKIQDKEKVQEIAFKSKLRSGWAGSENIYTASLLSTIPEYRGEARAYLRSAANWLSIFFEEQKKEKDEHPHEDKIRDQDILEFAYTHLNLHGVTGSAAFLKNLKPIEAVYRIVTMLAKRLIDSGQIEVLHEYAEAWKHEPYFLVAIAHELMQVGQFLKKAIAKDCFNKLANPKTRIPKPKEHWHEDRLTSTVISFLESCMHYRFSSDKINQALDYYVGKKANRMLVSDHSSNDRVLFLKALAIRLALAGKSEIEVEEIVPAEILEKKKDYDSGNELKKYKECILGLLPWFLLRANILHSDTSPDISQFETARSSSQKARTNRSGNYDPLPSDIAELVSSIMVLGHEEMKKKCFSYLKSVPGDFNVQIRLRLLHSACRTKQLEGIRDELEQITHELIESIKNDGPDEMADKYIALSRAIAINSVADAGKYFDQAVEIVSKFGDELIQRWEALQSLAEVGSESENVDDEFAYRFIRCAELVGNYISREKYWSRSNAARVDAKLSPSTALAAISRWRDRCVGRYQYQLEAIVTYLATEKIISPACAWAMTHFFEGRQHNELVEICLKAEETIAVKQEILDDAVRVLRSEGTNGKAVHELSAIALKSNLSNESLSTLADHFSNNNATITDEQDYQYLRKRNDQPDPKFDSLFKDVQLDSLDGLKKILSSVGNKPENDSDQYAVRTILMEALARVKQNEVYKFIDGVLNLDDIGMYDAKAVLFGIPDGWKNKPALKAAWPSLIRKFGKEYASELANKYSFENAINDLQLTYPLISELKQGMVEGFQNENGLGDEDSFFGFCNLAAPILTPKDALELADYAIRRFELHMDDSLGDGPYSNQLAVESNVEMSIAGFIWSALGSPWGWERWNAAHAVRSMFKFNCTNIIDALFGFMKKGEVGAYGSAEYVFYKLHAIQYFFISLARVALEDPHSLVKHKEAIKEYALDSGHFLIQKFAAETALRIAQTIPKSYDDQTLTLLHQVGKSPFASKKVKYDYRTNSVFHEKKEIDITIKFHFGWDFDHYWFEPLGDVFGISGKQVEDIAADVIGNEWNLDEKNGYQKDPRLALWNRTDRETWHDHGSYPKTDRMDFYLSYHSMMVAAAKLLKAMPVVQSRDYIQNPLLEWQDRHDLSMKDGRWLSDVRGSLPLKRPDWINSQRTEKWQTDITANDFRERLVETVENHVWITVGGGWFEKDTQRKEDVSIRSAFVATETSDALMRALQSCEDHHDYKIPDYEEDDMESDHWKFELKGWIEYPSSAKGLDNFDYRAAEISYPIISVGESILSNLNLEVEFDTYKEFGTKEIVMKVENWSTDRGDRDEYVDQCGMRLKAKLKLIMQACKKYNSDLIIEISIDRDIIISKMGGSNKYGKPFTKILIISANGTIRTTEGNFRIR